MFFFIDFTRVKLKYHKKWLSLHLEKQTYLFTNILAAHC